MYAPNLTTEMLCSCVCFFVNCQMSVTVSVRCTASLASIELSAPISTVSPHFDHEQPQQLLLLLRTARNTPSGERLPSHSIKVKCVRFQDPEWAKVWQAQQHYATSEAYSRSGRSSTVGVYGDSSPPSPTSSQHSGYSQQQMRTQQSAYHGSSQGGSTRGYQQRR